MNLRTVGTKEPERTPIAATKLRLEVAALEVSASARVMILGTEIGPFARSDNGENAVMHRESAGRWHRFPPQVGIPFVAVGPKADI